MTERFEKNAPNQRPPSFTSGRSGWTGAQGLPSAEEAAAAIERTYAQLRRCGVVALLRSKQGSAEATAARG
eukprot:4793523-Pleurochrysis_carterae.AAC.1